MQVEEEVEGEISWRSVLLWKKTMQTVWGCHFYMRLYEYCGRQEGQALLSLRNNMWLMYATYIIPTCCDS
jgi:hypothetical protein